MGTRILITGASGLIGTRLTEMLLQRGYEVVHLSRSQKQGSVKTFTWDVKKQTLDPQSFQGVDSIVHLGGAGIADKAWTRERKREILESRTQSSRLLFNELKKSDYSIRSFISASAIGYYGFDDNEHLFRETDEPGRDFLSGVVQQWEAEVDKIQNLGLRVVKVRIGVVLSEKGGVLKEVARPVKLYAGAPLGSGEQNVSWIHIDDLCEIFIKALEDERMQGAYNGVGPYAVTNRELTRVIAKTLGKPIILPAIPSFALKLFLGEMASLVLTGSRISSEKIERLRFKFRFSTLEKALEDLLLQ